VTYCHSPPLINAPAWVLADVLDSCRKRGLAVHRLCISNTTRSLGVRSSLFNYSHHIRSHSPSFRHYIGILRQETLLDALHTRLEQLSPVYDFKVLELQPQRKDGGVFVRFSYSPPHTPDADNWSALQTALGKEIRKHGPLPTWFGVGSGQLWVVRGSPWKEVSLLLFAMSTLSRYFSSRT